MNWLNSIKNKELIQGHPRLVLLIKLAIKTGKIKYSPQSVMTEFNEETGKYVRQGYYAEDVTGFWYPDSLTTYIKGNWENWKSGYEDFGFWKAWKFLSLSLPWSAWCFVVDAKKTIAYDIVDDQIVEERKQKGKKVDTANYVERMNQVTAVEIQEHLQKNYHQIAPAIWVSPQDPSVFIYDEAFKPFALADGWNEEQMGEIMAEWFEALTGVKVKPKYIANASW